MGFRQSKRKQPQFADLKGVLSQSKQTDNALYQTVQILIERLTQFQLLTLDTIAEVQEELDELGQPELPTEPEVEFDHYDCPLTDGLVPNTELIFAAGECIIVQVPI